MIYFKILTVSSEPLVTFKYIEYLFTLYLVTEKQF